MFSDYDIIVVGAGHAGCEAAAAAANKGSKVLLITMNMQTIAQMSCNPAMGGIAKGQIVREIDALGGYSGIVSDRSMIQFRMLNRSKGPAMWSPRTQNDRGLFAMEWRQLLENSTQVDFWQDMVTSLLVKKGRIKGVKTQMGQTIKARAVILTNGTFLNGLIHIGKKQFGGGRAGEHSALGITEQLVSLGFEAGRMKTGTPPRIDGRSLQYDKMEEQKGDETPSTFSFTNTKGPKKQRSCHIAYTNPTVHEILESGFEDSPMFNGRIQGVGPRYCPSIEDKINRFADRERHQLFIEPEGWNTVEIYLNGFSSSLSESVQFRALKEIKGFEKVKMFRPGYAIEYDFFQPTQLQNTLETKFINGLFFAGQINGTTGYEEAACQGLWAGINAHNKINEQEAFILKRSEAYMGVLIDDLINKGTDEPYRMFTSRAEFRLLLRQDNADIRLSPIGHREGLISDKRLELVEERKNNISQIINSFKKQSISPEEVNPLLQKKQSSPLRQKVKLISVISRPGIQIEDLISIQKEAKSIYSDSKNLKCAEIEMKYSGYIEKEKEIAKKLNTLDKVNIPTNTDYSKIGSLSAECVEKLSHIQPKTLGQASRISGISPSDISVLLIKLNQ
tara:strand:- start:1868 stop:3724 length:1857 start_codon:yes stop_codon:yes gene_type:complete